MSPSLAAKQEPIAAHPPQQQQHQVAMEFKENPGKIWMFPSEASVEFSPANDRDSAQIAASFPLPLPLPAHEVSERTERTNRASSSSQVISMTIMQATPALWEGLELAVSGTHTVVSRPPPAKPKSGSSRPHIPSTHSEDTSEILGSGKAVKQPSPTNGVPTKRQQDKVADHTSKPTKPKQPKEQDEKGRGTTAKGSSNSGGTKRASTSGSASNTSQKRCGYCNCTTTPMWRRGPNGPSTLCNACGVKWKHGKIMQDVTDGPTAASSGQGSNATSSAPRTSNSKSAKEPHENGYNRQTEAKKSPSKANHSGGGSSRTSHDTSRGGSDSPQDKPTTKHARNGGRRGSDADKIVPVKKRHLASSVSPPGGPRMVFIHELDDLSRPGSNSSSFNPKKHGYDEDNDDDSNAYISSGNGREKQRKNGVFQSTVKDDSHPSSATSIPASTRSTHHDGYNHHDDTSPLQHSPSLADDSLSLYATKNLYTNNTATFPLHFPTISIGFGPNNAYYTYPNCAVILFENHFQIKLIQGGERTEIDVWKEGIEGTEFQVVDVGDGESMIVMKALLRQYLTRFDKELLNPDRNESLIIFRFRERLDGGGPSVKPLLEHWLATDIPVPPAHPFQDSF
ncbi:hypothetical protein BGX23_007614 [Mortierella sp. AD031]|nr:hypothetical protein BGX23_007614 [Mortierella sp. AD031]